MGKTYTKAEFNADVAALVAKYFGCEGLFDPNISPVKQLARGEYLLAIRGPGLALLREESESRLQAVRELLAKYKALQMDAADFASELENSYSSDRYVGGWTGCIRMLRRRGMNDQQIEAVIRSKWTGWAADRANKPYGRATSTDLARLIEVQPDFASQVAQLVEETF